MNEYEEWNKIKFKIIKNKDSYIIRSVDFPAIPIVEVFSSTTNIRLAKLEVLNSLNKYNKKLRWTNETVGDASNLKKHKLRNNKIYYSFHLNTMDDLEFI